MFRINIEFRINKSQQFKAWKSILRMHLKASSAIPCAEALKATVWLPHEMTKGPLLDVPLLY